MFAVGLLQGCEDFGEEVGVVAAAGFEDEFARGCALVIGRLVSLCARIVVEVRR